MEKDENLDELICAISFENEKHFLVDPIAFPDCAHFVCKPCLKEKDIGNYSPAVLCNLCSNSILRFRNLEETCKVSEEKSEKIKSSLPELSGRTQEIAKELMSQFEGKLKRNWV